MCRFSPYRFLYTLTICVKGNTFVLWWGQNWMVSMARKHTAEWKLATVWETFSQRVLRSSEVPNPIHQSNAVIHITTSDVAEDGPVPHHFRSFWILILLLIHTVEAANTPLYAHCKGRNSPHHADQWLSWEREGQHVPTVRAHNSHHQTTATTDSEDNKCMKFRLHHLKGLPSPSAHLRSPLNCSNVMGRLFEPSTQLLASHRQWLTITVYSTDFMAKFIKVPNYGMPLFGNSLYGGIFGGQAHLSKHGL